MNTTSLRFMFVVATALMLAVKANAEILTMEYEAVLEPAPSRAGRLVS